MSSLARSRGTAMPLLALVLSALLTVLLPAPASAGAAEDNDFVARVNSARAAAGLPGLRVAADLAANAAGHAAAMGRANSLHHNPNLSSQIGNWRSLGENVGYGGSVAGIHTALMNSPGHRANILSTVFTEIGVGTYLAPGGRLWVTQVFRTPVRATAAAPVAPPTAIEAKYAALGGSRALGVPTSGEHLLHPGAYRHYSIGSIYWTPATGAQSVKGDIRGTWARLGWERSGLSWPTTDELGTPDGRGRYNHFLGGSIYWTPTTGAREVRGDIRGAWARLGWERSALGYPVTDEHGTPDRVGRFTAFERGSIYWTPRTGAHEVRGDIRAAWGRLGWEQGRLGYPVSDEYAVPGGRRTDFERGSIFWDARTGATTVQ